MLQFIKKVTEKLALPEGQKPSYILAADDTLIEKFGTHFEDCGTLFDHDAKSKEDRYIDGHCFPGLMILIPVKGSHGTETMLSLPLAIRMWDSSQTKLELIANLLRKTMEILGNDCRIIFECDAWYPKGEVLKAIQEYPNIDMIANARIDTVMYNEPVSGGRGRPLKHGSRIDVRRDFELEEIPGADFLIGSRSVLTRLFGDDQHVLAVVTKNKSNDDPDTACRLYISTMMPEEFDEWLLGCISCDRYALYGRHDKAYIPYSFYSLHWKIEIFFYESKFFWSFDDYMLRSKSGIETLINLLSFTVLLMRLLPYSNVEFSALKCKTSVPEKYAVRLDNISEIG